MGEYHLYTGSRVSGTISAKKLQQRHDPDYPHDIVITPNVIKTSQVSVIHLEEDQADFLVQPDLQTDHVLATVKKGQIAGQFVFMTPRNEIIDELSSNRESGDFTRKQLLEQIPNLPYPQYMGGGILHLTPQWGSIFHFLVEVLPSLYYYRERTFDWYYCRINSPYHAQYLDLLGIEKNRLIAAHPCCNITADEVVKASEICVPEALDWFTNFVSERVGRTAFGQGHEKFFISRKDANNGRRLLNEDELFGFLRGEGFKSVLLSKLTPQEQVDLFRNAKFVISASGGGFVHSIYSPTGTKFIEMTHKALQDNVGLAAINCNSPKLWSRVFMQRTCEYLPPSLKTSPEAMDRHADLIVDMKKFKRLYTMLDNM